MMAVLCIVGVASVLAGVLCGYMGWALSAPEVIACGGAIAACGLGLVAEVAR